MYPTTYHKPTSAADAVGLLVANGEARVLAGGQTLIATMKQHLAAPTDLVDIRALPGLKVIRRDGDTLVIGAAVTHAEVAGSAVVQGAIGALAALAGAIGDPMVRHMGTIGGSLANNDPSADYPAAALALGATFVTTKREIEADAYFTGLFATALDADEIITEVHLPVPVKAGYAKFAQPASRFALVGVFVAQTAGGARVAVTGAGEEGVFRADPVEAALTADWSASAAEAASVAADGLIDDIHGSPAYRAALIPVMAGRAVTASL